MHRNIHRATLCCYLFKVMTQNFIKIFRQKQSKYITICDRVNVSLPRVWVQEIKCMPVMYFTHGLFLTCTQKSCFIYKSCIAICQNLQQFWPEPTPCIGNKTTPFTYLKSQLLCSWWRIPSTLVSVSQQLPHPWLLPFSAFHTLQFNYIIYIDNINNLGCPRVGQLRLNVYKL